MKTVNVEILKIDVPNGNGRIYDIEAARKIAADFKIKPSVTCIGKNLGMPADGVTVSISHASHVVKNISVITMHDPHTFKEVHKITADIQFLNTPQGRLAEEMYNKGEGVFRTSCTGLINDFGFVTVQKFHAVHFINKSDDAWTDYIKKPKHNIPITREIPLGEW